MPAQRDFAAPTDADAATAALQDLHAPSSKRRLAPPIVDVDVDPTLRSIVCTMLCSSNIRALQLETAEEARDWLSKNSTDLLLLDWGPPPA